MEEFITAQYRIYKMDEHEKVEYFDITAIQAMYLYRLQWNKRYRYSIISNYFSFRYSFNIIIFPIWIFFIFFNS